MTDDQLKSIIGIILDLGLQCIVGCVYPNTHIYFIVSGEISVYLVKIKVVSITSELISYHFTND